MVFVDCTDYYCNVMDVLYYVLIVDHMHAGEGAPDYAALYMNRSIKSLPFPEPFPQPTPYKLDNNTGYVRISNPTKGFPLM